MIHCSGNNSLHDPDVFIVARWLDRFHPIGRTLPSRPANSCSLPARRKRTPHFFSTTSATSAGARIACKAGRAGNSLQQVASRANALAAYAVHTCSLTEPEGHMGMDILYRVID